MATVKETRNPILQTVDGQQMRVTVVRPVGATGGNVACEFGDSPSIDAFARLRVSNPETLFDSKNIFNDPDLADTLENQPLFYDNQETAGGGTGTSYDNDKACQFLSVSDTTAGTRVRQTKMRFNYQPGKSQLVLLTFVLGTQAAGITRREGIFDESDGIYLEDTGSGYNLVRRSSGTGAVVNTSVARASWNIDPMDGTGTSGVTLDFTKTQILLIDYEWLGVGRVRIGFVIDGIPIYCHQFLNANNLDLVYMQTPNLPLRSEITNDGTGPAATMSQICSTVISEGGSQDLGSVRYASTAGTHIDANTQNTAYAILGIRLKSAYLGASIKILNAELAEHAGNNNYEWFLVLNPTVAGTFTYADVSQSAIQVATGATANTVTGGYQITGGYASSAVRGGTTSSNINNAIRLGSLIDGTVDEIVLCVRPVGGSTNLDIEGSLTWRELT